MTATGYLLILAATFACAIDALILGVLSCTNRNNCPNRLALRGITVGISHAFFAMFGTLVYSLSSQASTGRSGDALVICGAVGIAYLGYVMGKNLPTTKPRFGWSIPLALLGVDAVVVGFISASIHAPLLFVMSIAFVLPSLAFVLPGIACSRFLKSDGGDQYDAHLQ